MILTATVQNQLIELRATGLSALKPAGGRTASSLGTEELVVEPVTSGGTLYVKFAQPERDQRRLRGRRQSHLWWQLTTISGEATNTPQWWRHLGALTYK